MHVQQNQNQLSIIGSGPDGSVRFLFAWWTELNKMSLMTYTEEIEPYIWAAKQRII